ncbi:hypothetical protein GCM10027169_11250 [Gordonia jinhuaensis]|uniref:Acyl-CoA dehydrogenase n=1 Tax=Gordonia jinhuaensis TaxID=1517702 RepID=A0A916T620_9ACTN|nr:acyl-CoA dehydrogenase [Gordonia jinhuaensis]GGB31142.1 hypothetical protein GCM10011489_19180 [Gordonia jinhuaensis]
MEITGAPHASTTPDVEAARPTGVLELTHSPPYLTQPAGGPGTQLSWVGLDHAPADTTLITAITDFVDHAGIDHAHIDGHSHIDLTEVPHVARAIADADGLLAEWSAMATVAAHGLTLARVVEPDVDALTILAASDTPLADDVDALTWGVFAAEGRGRRLEAHHTDRGWELTGSKPWCSLAHRLDRALVTAWTSAQSRRLFAIDLTRPDVTVGDDPWVARGLVTVESPSITCQQTPATPVGDDGWYLRRPGFAEGGIRVAAIWFGAAVGLGRTLRDASARPDLDQIGCLHLGAVDSALYAARCVLRDAAMRVSWPDTDPWVVALHARRAVREAAEDVLRHTHHALGPTPLVRDEQHAARVADLTVYLRQEHAERDAAALGSRVHDGKGLVL